MIYLKTSYDEAKAKQLCYIYLVHLNFFEANWLENKSALAVVTLLHNKINQNISVNIIQTRSDSATNLVQLLLISLFVSILLTSFPAVSSLPFLASWFGIWIWNHQTAILTYEKFSQYDRIPSSHDYLKLSLSSANLYCP